MTRKRILGTGSLRAVAPALLAALAFGALPAGIARAEDPPGGPPSQGGSPSQGPGSQGAPNSGGSNGSPNGGGQGGGGSDTTPSRPPAGQGGGNAEHPPASGDAGKPSDSGSSGAQNGGGSSNGGGDAHPTPRGQERNGQGQGPSKGGGAHPPAGRDPKPESGQGSRGRGSDDRSSMPPVAAEQSPTPGGGSPPAFAGADAASDAPGRAVAADRAPSLPGAASVRSTTGPRHVGALTHSWMAAIAGDPLTASLGMATAGNVARLAAAPMAAGQQRSGGSLAFTGLNITAFVLAGLSLLALGLLLRHGHGTY